MTMVEDASGNRWRASERSSPAVLRSIDLSSTAFIVKTDSNVSSPSCDSSIRRMTSESLSRIGRNL